MKSKITSGYENWSSMDRKYAEMFGCWHCDKEKWQKKELTLEAFERRDQQALENAEQNKGIKT